MIHSELRAEEFRGERDCWYICCSLTELMMIYSLFKGTYSEESYFCCIESPYEYDYHLAS